VPHALKSIDFVRELDRRTGAREPFAVATVVGIEGSSIGKPGFKAIVSGEGRIVYGSIGGVCPESAISPFALDTMKTGKARTVKIFLEDAQKAVASTLATTPSDDEVHVETNCGGVMQIYIEPYLPADRIIILSGGGRDGLEDALIRLGKFLDFEVVVIDPTPEFEEEPDELITERDYDITRYAYTDSDSVVILTHSAKDVPILTFLSTKKIRYVGLMASRDRARGELNFLIKRGVPREFVESVKSPVGADIGAKTSREIAISIISEIIATKRGKTMHREPVVLQRAPGEMAQHSGHTS
jgi:xanthine dehydrogenase accessory factor